MDTMTPDVHAPTDLSLTLGDPTDDEVRAQVCCVLGSLYPRGSFAERRREHRYPFPYLVHLTPLANDGMSPVGEAVVVVGKHLSERGLGFYHPQPIPHRRVIATLEVDGESPQAFVVDLAWCRFTKQGWYESGGRFLQAVAPPTDRL